ncbi:hypothetical protein WISP_107340 [Willisornis vidua]|uniref:Uncharacterized protein n=1 Tax=Willisornis vidua TaxID=1566151 RepID=A0ABQ9CWQ6_9PASS|nr:hypothetical protein WISP_107340 [Willisornis vidua]
MEQQEMFVENSSHYLELDTIGKVDKRTNGMDLMDQASLLQFISSLMAHESEDQEIWTKELPETKPTITF